MLRWLLLAVAVTVAAPMPAAADTPPIVRLRKSKAPIKAEPAKPTTAQASKTKRARKKVRVAKRSTKATTKKAAKKASTQKRARVAVRRPMP